jgi:hypothetical protein
MPKNKTKSSKKQRSSKTKKKTTWAQLGSQPSDRHHNLHLSEGRGKVEVVSSQTLPYDDPPAILARSSEDEESSSEPSESEREEQEYGVIQNSGGEVTEENDEGDYPKGDDEKDEEPNKDEDEQKDEPNKDEPNKDEPNEDPDDDDDQGEQEQPPIVVEPAPRRHVRVAGMGWTTNVTEGSGANDIRRLLRRRQRDPNKPLSGRALALADTVENMRTGATWAVERLGALARPRGDDVRAEIAQVRHAVNAAREAAAAARAAVAEATDYNRSDAEAAAAKAEEAVREAQQALEAAEKAWRTRLPGVLQSEQNRRERVAAVIAALHSALEATARAERETRNAVFITGSPDVLDMGLRVALLADMLRRADGNLPAATAEQGALDADGQVMRVFAAPEWLFRRSDRPLTEQEKDDILAQLTHLAAEYPQWLIVPGTIFFTTSPPGALVNDVFNIAPVFHEGQVRLLTKQHEQDALVTAADRISAPWKTLERWAAAGSESRIFTTGDGLRYAVEICRDHVRRMALLDADLQTVDVQIVVSNGVELQTDSIIARHNGVVIQVDGAGGRVTAHRVVRNRPLEELRAIHQQLTAAEQHQEGIVERIAELQDSYDVLAARKNQLEANQDLAATPNGQATLRDLQALMDGLLLQIQPILAELGDADQAVEQLHQQLRTSVTLTQIHRQSEGIWIPDALLDLLPEDE